MRKLIFFIGVASLACLSATAIAQDEEPAESYIYATYFVCDVTGQDDVDEFVASTWKPVYDKAVADGKITGWGWLAHHTGGQWRRVSYLTAPSIEGLLAAQDHISEAIEQASGDSKLFGKICNSHDDYIWHGVAGSGGDVLATPRGKVGLSAYHICDMATESRADQLVKTVFAPVYDAHVGDGKLRSWGWSEHIVGGEYRRLSTMTADDWPTLFKMRASIFEALQDNDLTDQFTEICGSHSDYLWEIQIENP